jgi:hypothetical protein
MSSSVNRSFPGHRTQRGSVLVVALLFSMIIAIALGSYIGLGRTTLEIANRAYYNNVAMNLAETGLENGLYSFNRYRADDATAWTSWKSPADAGDAAHSWGGFTYEGGNTGSVRVYVDNYDSLNPTLLARSTVTLHRGAQIEKWIRVVLAKRSLFDLGMVAKTITMSGGNVTLDSYDSRHGTYNQALADGTRNRYAGITVGSTSLEDDTFNLSNSTVNGYVSVGTPGYDGLKLGPLATVGPIGATGIDYSRVNRDFRMDFDDATFPATPSGTPTVASISNTTLLSAASGALGADLNAKKNVYYLNVGEISLSGGKSLTIGTEANPVNMVILITKTSGTGIQVTGNDDTIIRVAKGSSLQIYTAANVSIGGGGIANANEPANFMLYGTRPQSASTPQDISISGNGNLSAVVYAPGADITMNGGGVAGHVYGSVVGNTVKLTGGSSFHYDESLKDLDLKDAFRLHTWQELTTIAQRDLYRSKLEF